MSGLRKDSSVSSGKIPELLHIACRKPREVKGYKWQGLLPKAGEWKVRQDFTRPKSFPALDRNQNNLVVKDPNESVTGKAF